MFALGCGLIASGIAWAPVVAAAPDPRDNDIACAGDDLARCYGGDQTRELAGTGRRLVTEYLDGVGIPADALPELVYVPAGGSAGSQCVDAHGRTAQHDRSYNYCVTDNTIYIGQHILWDFSQRYGPWGPLSGIAHEYGHFLQAVRHVPSPVDAAETIRNENQADCFSGAFVSSLQARDTLGPMEPAVDIAGIESYLTATASVEAPGRDHGTAEERIESFALGHRGGLAACSQFYPATPLSR